MYGVVQNRLSVHVEECLRCDSSVKPTPPAKPPVDESMVASELSDLLAAVAEPSGTHFLQEGLQTVTWLQEEQLQKHALLGLGLHCFFVPTSAGSWELLTAPTSKVFLKTSCKRASASGVSCFGSFCSLSKASFAMQQPHVRQQSTG